MRSAAHQYVTSEHASETHMLSVMEQAYRLRGYWDEHKDEVDGVLGNADIAEPRRFHRLLKAAFHNDQLDDKSRISRCANALQHAWTQDTPADDLRTFIASKGGIVKCGKANKAVVGGNGNTAHPEPIPIPCDVPIDLMGHVSVAGTLKTNEAGGFLFIPSKALSPVRKPGRAQKPSQEEPVAT
jgi:hypothetical protein